jgi:recombinational DNA repair protein RecR
MVRVRPRSLRKKIYKARSAEDRCHVCGNLRNSGNCKNRFCTEYHEPELIEVES